MPLLLPPLLLLQACTAVAVADSWPAHVQPFFLSALSQPLTPPQARYIGAFPLAVINHKQSNGDTSAPVLGAEAKQLQAIAAIRAANRSCTTYFYLNSQIDFPELALHTKMAAAAGDWWLRDASGSFVWHNKSAVRGDGDHVFDLTVAEARQAWIDAALQALNNDAVDGLFVDKAKSDSVKFRGVSATRMAAWRAAHDSMLAALRHSTTKLVILNNQHASPDKAAGMGQLFERWGESPDHDGLNLTQDIALLGKLQTAGLTTLARAGGVAPGSSHAPSSIACGTGLAAFLIAQTAPNHGFFSCEPDFRSGVSPPCGWMALLQQPEYSYALGAPLGPPKAASSGLIRRQYAGGAEAILAIGSAGDGTGAASGCVRWAGGHISGRCPVEVANSDDTV